MTTSPMRLPSHAVDDRIVRIDVHLAQNVRFRAEERRRRTATKIASMLGVAASAVSLYDLVLLAMGSH